MRAGVHPASHATRPGPGQRHPRAAERYSGGPRGQSGVPRRRSEGGPRRRGGAEGHQHRRRAPRDGRPAVRHRYDPPRHDGDAASPPVRSRERPDRGRGRDPMAGADRPSTTGIGFSTSRTPTRSARSRRTLRTTSPRRGSSTGPTHSTSVSTSTITTRGWTASWARRSGGPR